MKCRTASITSLTVVIVIVLHQMFSESPPITEFMPIFWFLGFLMIIVMITIVIITLFTYVSSKENTKKPKKNVNKKKKPINNKQDWVQVGVSNSN